jgi:hypothetical protein
MNYGKMLGYTMAVVSIGACACYFLAGDVRRGLYWMFAAGITISVTY